MANSRRDRLNCILSDIIEMSDAAADLVEELQLTRRDPISRIERRVREKASALTNKIMRARRERRARNREHSRKGVKPPAKYLSTRLRIR